MTLVLCKKSCGREVLTGFASCAVCLEKSRVAGRKDYYARAARGQCVYCQDRAEVGMFCLTHWFKNIGVSHGLGNKRGIALLRQLWNEQKGRCAVTGELLVPGITASIDHAIPKSKGGLSNKENLRWVLLNINRAKWDMTHDEFVEVCRLVVRTHDHSNVTKPTNFELVVRSN